MKQQPRTEFVRVEDIEMERGRRVPSRDAIERIARSMAEIGLKTPITVRYMPNRVSETGTEDSFLLVAGAHRLAAAKQLGWAEIECFMANGASDEEAELWEIDENLCRAELSDAEEAIAISRRKELYEIMHPETKPTVTGGAGRNKATRRQFGDDTVADRFTADTAAKTGKAERTIQRAAKRGKEIGAEILSKIAGTSLDKGVELDALASLTPEKRAPIIERAVAGEKVSARPAPVRPVQSAPSSPCCPHCGAPSEWREMMRHKEHAP